MPSVSYSINCSIFLIIDVLIFIVKFSLFLITSAAFSFLLYYMRHSVPFRVNFICGSVLLPCFLSVRLTFFSFVSYQLISVSCLVSVALCLLWYVVVSVSLLFPLTTSAALCFVAISAALCLFVKTALFLTISEVLCCLYRALNPSNVSLKLRGSTPYPSSKDLPSQLLLKLTCYFTSTETSRLIKNGSPGRPPRLSRSS